jgi:hypothetical protein
MGDEMGNEMCNFEDVGLGSVVFLVGASRLSCAFEG